MPKISHTAAYIVVKFYGLTKFPEIAKKFDPFVLDFYKNMIGFLPSHLSWYQNSLNSHLLRKFFIWSEELLLPGDLMHIICRKYYMTKLVDEALKDGIEQVVSMGAGFDHLGAYASSKGISSFELDVEFMIHEKQKFINASGYESDQLHFKSVGFEKKTLAESLNEIETFDSTKKTLFIGEGFFDYLPLETSKEILKNIRSLNYQNQLLTTFFSLDELNWFHRFSFTSGVSLVGESLKLPLNRAAFIELLKEFSFSVDKEISYSEMEKDLVPSIGMNQPVLKGFYILNSLMINR
ncbi:MAG: class I SAM-dependent methyltransferase [Balneolaceae bacterium]|nr:class I SAM-dependent methyltransferase [Balneolaceae bacterium]MBO6547052.1 class I SAM-dependent methyltransferase [Balneolaceae bacterium]MBO6648001.1 class I SAM-dependent methyltransferase [Balneolaceae bacterium]